MQFSPKRWMRGVSLVAAIGLMAACQLPKSGPNKTEILAGAVQNGGNAFVVEVDDRVTRLASAVPQFGFSSSFSSAQALTADTVRPGDVLGLTIWENVDDGLLSGETGAATILDEVQVDSDGFIFVPYAGRIRAAGNTPEQLRVLITNKLREQTPDPQIEVRRVAGDGSTVSLTGTVATPGIYPIERPTRSLLGMLSKAGGVSVASDIALVTLIRGDQKGTVWYEDLFRNPKLDVALRGGDRILVEEDSRSYIALGATGGQSRVAFDSQDLTALEALAQVGGLLTLSSDPTGIFILRKERQDIARSITGRADLKGDQRMIYLLNLTAPNGLFIARDFVIRDDDTIYVTEAPYAQWSKSISLIAGGLTPIANVATLTGN
ncbi:polysaccharide biosynthesis/export family protein [Ruegeria sp. THAF33]|uniref:Polysaccharide export protein n=2 Tax=Roseobacteraceae TaxID=2854170 RepID=A0ABX1W9U7_9RHOB|nr:polysaccharide biosynthesis/export family protein [Ruegeria sp. THAF33]NOC81946.1 polysaccharide export protein [Ruegeria sp. HKCCD6428]NOC92999.1 polysaccharide export protein [Ruegeria sp. HKCCD6604]NOD30045.1 polysaccharide export protein [Ruegeria atlantica]QFT72434.1 Polysialic acid transport protein KpsD precursor [Ruegeria sp. THAF33]